MVMGGVEYELTLLKCGSWKGNELVIFSLYHFVGSANAGGGVGPGGTGMIVGGVEGDLQQQSSAVQQEEKKYYKLNVHPPEFYPEDLIIRFCVFV